MLVLSRKKNEAIMIGDIEIIVVEIRGDKCRLGIEADRKIPVHRKEVYDAIKKQDGENRSLAEPTINANEERTGPALPVYWQCLSCGSAVLGSMMAQHTDYHRDHTKFQRLALVGGNPSGNPESPPAGSPPA